MGPLDNIGPYAETTITTRRSDVDKTDNKPGVFAVLIGLFLLGPALWVATFMGLFCWAYIGPISATAVIGLLLWACGHYGTNRSILDRFRYRTTEVQRAKIARRLLDH